MRTFSFLVFLIGSICMCVSCKTNVEDGYVMYINTIDCISCTDGIIYKISTPEFNQKLRENNVTVVFPDMREVEQKKTLKDYSVDGMNVVFSDEKMEYYKKLSGTNISAILKIKSGEVKEVTELRYLNHRKYEFNLE